MVKYVFLFLEQDNAAFPFLFHFFSLARFQGVLVQIGVGDTADRKTPNVVSMIGEKGVTAVAAGMVLATLSLISPFPMRMR